jgi:hypothetical protein
MSSEGNGRTSTLKEIEPYQKAKLAKTEAHTLLHYVAIGMSDQEIAKEWGVDLPFVLQIRQQMRSSKGKG